MSNCISKFAVFEYLKHDWNFRIFLQFKLYVKSIEVTKTAFLTISAAVNLDFFNFWHFQFEISKIKGLKSNCDNFFLSHLQFILTNSTARQKKWRWLRKKKDVLRIYCLYFTSFKEILSMYFRNLSDDN